MQRAEPAAPSATSHHQGLKFRQQETLARAFGCARVVFNDGLRVRQEARKAGLPYVSDGDVRSWTCLCGAVHDRDVNAAIDVLAQGRWDNSNACGAQVRPAPVPAQRREVGIRPGAARRFRAQRGGNLRPLD
ncbi:helix-turn-helix domain-containing protein [Micromonospora sp. NPDC052213]|uniref:helix-turn-helix domain-containing protein n=1 Tax=Micromonospora sp. NPDC052213 TaxID=3155812 RepID=UPI00342C378A